MSEDDKKIVLELIKQAKEGKQSAFTRLYNKFKQTIYITIYQIVKNKDVTDDLLSVTFTKAFTKIDSYVNNISFEMWLKTIAVNSSIDYIRRSKREQYDLSVDNEDYNIQLSSTADYSPEDIFIGNETHSLLNDALFLIRPSYKKILLLRAEKNLSYREIAERMNLNENQVKSLLNKARKKLKQMLN